jgi:hypothetical protein
LRYVKPRLDKLYPNGHKGISTALEMQTAQNFLDAVEGAGFQK